MALMTDVMTVDSFIGDAFGKITVVESWNRLKKELEELSKTPTNPTNNAIAFVKKLAISSKCSCSMAAARNCLHCEAESIAQQH